MTELRRGDARALPFAADDLPGAYALPEAFDDPGLTAITDFAARLCDAPMAVVSLVGEDRQTFIARHGVPMDGSPRATSFCATTMLDRRLLIVPDARSDARFADYALVTGPPHIRFYAGAPLLTPEGAPLGALCVLDPAPRPGGLTDRQQEGLRVLAAAALERLDRMRIERQRADDADEAAQALSDSELRFRLLADAMPQMVWSTRPDGYHDYYNARWYDYTGMPPGSTDGEGWNGMFHPDDQDRAWAAWRRSLATGEPYEIEYRLRRADGVYRWTLGRALAMRDGGGRIVRWFGTCTDIHEQKLAFEEREIISQELSHRIKNIFSVIAGLIALAARGEPQIAPLAGRLRDRIMALGRAHDFVRPHSAGSHPGVRQDSLQGLLDQLFAPYALGEGSRIVVRGDDVRVDDRSATPLALLFHELATNAAKHGALSTADGSVRLDIVAEGDRVGLLWREAGGPPVEPPTRTSFGTQLLDLSVRRQLGGDYRADWPATGLVMHISLPRASISRNAAG
jgi:PAS domain S-box-containing protein